MYCWWIPFVSSVLSLCIYTEIVLWNLCINDNARDSDEDAPSTETVLLAPNGNSVYAGWKRIVLSVCRTALMLAALGSHTDCVHILLEKGAQADAADRKGRTALHRAVSGLDVFIYVASLFVERHNSVERGRKCTFTAPWMSLIFLLLILNPLSSHYRPWWVVKTAYVPS